MLRFPVTLFVQDLEHSDSAHMFTGFFVFFFKPLEKLIIIVHSILPRNTLFSSSAVLLFLKFELCNTNIFSYLKPVLTGFVWFLFASFECEVF